MAFQCPKCGGSTWGTEQCENGEVIRHCHGYGDRETTSRERRQVAVLRSLNREATPAALNVLGFSPDGDRVRGPCTFQWPAGDDAEYGVEPPDEGEVMLATTSREPYERPRITSSGPADERLEPPSEVREMIDTHRNKASLIEQCERLGIEFPADATKAQLVAILRGAVREGSQ